MTTPTPNIPAPHPPGTGKRRQERRLDHELDDSFPASDPPALTDPSRRSGEPDPIHRNTDDERGASEIGEDEDRPAERPQEMPAKRTPHGRMPDTRSS